MAFFSTLAPFLQKGVLKLVIMADGPQQPTEATRYNVSVHLDQPCGDVAAQSIPPFVLRGTAGELDADFLAKVQAALAAKATAVDTMEAFIAQVNRATQESQAQKQREQQEQKIKTDKEKAFEKHMKTVDELETARQYHKALGKLPSVADYPQEAEIIKARKKQLLEKLNAGSLFTNDESNPPC